MMATAQEAAHLAGDDATAALAKAAYDTGIAATGALLWNESFGYFRGACCARVRCYSCALRCVLRCCAFWCCTAISITPAI